MGTFFLVAMALALLFFAIGMVRDRRRYSNGIWLSITLIFFLLFLFANAAKVHWIGLALVTAFFGAVLLLVLVLPVALVINGVTMLRREGRRPANLLSLLAGLGMFALYAAFWLTARIDVDWPRVVLGAIVLVSCYLAFLFVTFLLYSVVYSRTARRRKFDAVVVLGSGLIGERVPPLLASRLDQAVRIYQHAETAPVLVVSGGQGGDEAVSEAEAMAGYLVTKGIPEKDIELEDQARTTEENLRYSRAILDAREPRPKRIAAVTNNFHVLRTALLSRRIGVRLDVLGSPTAFYFLPSAFLREFVAIVLANRVVNGIICGVLGGGVLAIGLLV
ncbi:YdcF family protein [Sciscionella sediminilitoris]|uniref:YdcF family protein n=1 Tax=Sciscionella sediminilitoris TaxID=1445613 RepID=UPI0004DFB4E8|nr:YdcF family protein [Sciscionella sp. SE31]